MEESESDKEGIFLYNGLMMLGKLVVLCIGAISIALIIYAGITLLLLSLSAMETSYKVLCT